jgi:hypothetical protein
MISIKTASWLVISGDAKIFIHSENLKSSSLRRRKHKSVDEAFP